MFHVCYGSTAPLAHFKLWANICPVRPQMLVWYSESQWVGPAGWMNMSKNYRLLVKDARQVVLVCDQGQRFLTEHGMQNLTVIENGSVVVGR